MAHATDVRTWRGARGGPGDAGWPRTFTALAVPYLRILALLVLTAAVYCVRIRYHSADDRMFLTQDLPVLPLIVAGLVALRWAPGASAAVRAATLSRPWLTAGVAAAACALVAATAAPLVFGGYAPSGDEFMADFDARIFARGQLLAPVPPEWRPYLPAMMTSLGLPVPDHSAWASDYLPLNAAVRALAMKGGLQGLVNPLWSGIAVLATFAVARRLWPARPGLALGAAALLATSSQLLLMGMGAYAMPAHLALNLVWLLAFLRGGRIGHGAALVIGFLACGLHQFVFHPLFAAPFVLQLWLDRRWRLAALYTAAYAAICLFWISYGALLLKLAGAQPAAAPALGLGYLVYRLQPVIANLSPLSLGLMAEGLTRFCAWQNLIAAPLALIGAGAALRAKGIPRALALGVILTLVAMAALMPAQTAGWGYRYLHGLLGSVCLLAMLGWATLTDRLPSEAKARAAGAFLAACAASAFILAPLHAWQAWRANQPLAAAYARVAHAPAEVVLVDNSVDYFDASIVMRDDPFLVRGPKVMLLSQLGEHGVRAICARYSVLNFDGEDAAALGVPTLQLPRTASMDRLRALRTQLGCDRRIG